MTDVLKRENKVTDDTRVEDLGSSSYSYSTGGAFFKELELSPAKQFDIVTKKARTYESSYTSVHSDAPELSLHTLTEELNTLTDPIQFGILLNVPYKELAIIQRDHLGECMHASDLVCFIIIMHVDKV